MVNDTEQSSEQSRKKGLGELGPVWIGSIATLIVAMTGAGFFAGHAVATSTASTPSPKVITVTVTATAPAPSTPSSSAADGATPSPAAQSTVGNGTLDASYSFKLVNGYSAPLGLTAPTQAQIAASGNYDLYYNGSMEPGSSEKMVELQNGTTPTYSACTANTTFVSGLQPEVGMSACIVETSGYMAGVTVTATGTSPYSITVRVTLWKNVP
jgi:hypothetical protein